MKNYYFTFGQAHFTADGRPMRDYYVKVSAPDYSTARDHFCHHFALPIMGKLDRWAFQYEEDKFTEAMFPNGEYEHLVVS